MRKKSFLRDYAEHALPLVESIQKHLKGLAAAQRRGDREEQLHLHGPLGEAYRRLGRLDEARSHLEQAVSLAKEADHQRALVHNSLRLAVTLQYAGRHAEAEPWFVEAARLSQAHGFLQDHVALAYGKHLVETEQWPQAAEQLAQACHWRRERGTSEEAMAEAETTWQAAREAAGARAHCFDTPSV